MRKRMACSVLVVVMIMSQIFGITSVKAATRKIQVQTIALGSGHTAVIKADGSLWIWGENKSGQLGDGTNKSRNTMVKVMDNAASVSAGGGDTAVIKTDGSLWVWGSNYYGQLGDGTTKDKYKPVKIMDNVIAVSASGEHTAAIKADGTLWTWGKNNYGQLGNGTTTNGIPKGSKPIKIMDNAAAVSLGGFHSAAIKTDGSLWMWGWNSMGELGDYNTGNGASTIVNKPRKVMDNVAAVSLGAFHSAAVKKDGTLWMWGSNGSGQFGDGTKNNRKTLYKAMDDVVAISAGGYNMNALKKDGSLWTWGGNETGECGDGTDIDRYTPVKIMDGVASVSAGYERSAALKTDGSIWAYGRNYYPNTITSYLPAKVFDNAALPDNLQKTSDAASQEDIKVILNDKQITPGQPLVVKEGQLFVSYKDIFQYLGASAEWNNTSRILSAKKGNINLTMQPDYCVMSRNEQTFINTAAPMMVKDQLYVPLKAAVENLGGDYEYDENAKTVKIGVLWNENLSSMLAKKTNVVYEDKMKTFGFDKLYDNMRAETIEPVTKAEALKLAIAAVFNLDDTPAFGPVYYSTGDNDKKNKNDNWVEYAKSQGITKEDLNSDNFNAKATYIDVITYFENCKLKYLKDFPVKDGAVSFKDITSYSAEQQAAIKDMVAYGIITPLSDNLNGNDKIFKGQLNELVVNFAEKYNTLALLGDKVNTDPKIMPSNANEYPYTITTVDKSVYEIPPVKGFGYMSAKDLYKYKKELLSQVKEWTEAYLNGILNVDYRTITEESLMQKMSPYLIFTPDKSGIALYVKYVKANEIITEGSAKFQAPIIYFDGSAYRIRMKINFEIKHSKTRDNLLYTDWLEGGKITYTKDRYDMFADYHASNAIGNNNIYMEDLPLYKTILSREKCGIIVK